MNPNDGGSQFPPLGAEPESAPSVDDPPQNRAEAGSRDSLGRFGPGRSGNPGGRPKVQRSLRGLARSWTDEALGVIADVMRSSKVDRARLAAAELLLAYGWGRPSAGASPNQAQGEVLAQMENILADLEGVLSADHYEHMLLALFEGERERRMEEFRAADAEGAEGPSLSGGAG